MSSPMNPDAPDPLWSELAYVSSGENPQQRLIRAQELMTRIQELEIQIKEIRRQAAVALHESEHWSLQQIADFAGISKGRARQIVVDYEAPPRPGVMEHNIRIATAASNEADQRLRARRIFQAVRGIKGIEALPRQQWAAYTDIPEEVWQEILDTEV